jgi:hypothetical protein
MAIGKHLRELSRLRLGAAVSLLVATFGGVSAFYKIGFFPPSAEPRKLELATASTQVLVDTPRSTVLDLREDTYSFQSITNRAVLLGNVMASQPVLEYIGKRAGVPPEAIIAQTPLTPEFPRPFAVVGKEKKTSDILRSADEYRLSIHANPTVPILEVVAQASSARAAASLANAAVAGLRDYLDHVAQQQNIAQPHRVTLEQLGTPHGQVINEGGAWQAAVLFFLVGLGMASGLFVFAARMRRGWRDGARDEPGGEAGPKDPRSRRRRRRPDGDRPPAEQVAAPMAATGPGT